jgi:hypothetical protein
VSALASITTGFDNAANGSYALSSNTTGGDNTASGASALSYNTTGSDNTASGTFALSSNSTGSGDTAIGAFALLTNTIGNHNTASGTFALFSETTGSANTAEGYEALSSTTTGLNNTGLGASAGNPTNSQATTGSNNTYLGYFSNPGTQLNLNNATAIGANAQVTASNALVLGSINGVNGATASVNVGIGTTAPAYTLDVHGTANFTGPVTFAAGQAFNGNESVTGNLTDTGNITATGSVSAGSIVTGNTAINNMGCNTGIFGGIGFGPNASQGCQNYSLLGDGLNTYVNRPAGGVVVFREGNITEMVLASGGNFGIGTTAPQYPLHVNGIMRSESGLSLGGNASVAVDAPGVVGGRLAVLANGNVGINNPNPAATLDVAGSVRIGGDVAMSSNPRMFFSGFLVGNLGNEPVLGGFFVPDRNIVITRVSASENSFGHDCSTAAHASVEVGGDSPVTIFYNLDLGNNNRWPDSGSINVLIPAGTSLAIKGYSASGCGIGGSSPSDVNVSVQYVMQ